MSEMQNSFSETPGRKALLAGATGLVGSQILWGLLSDSRVAEIHVLCRRPLSVRHARVIEHQVDYSALPVLPAVDEVYLALGTTIRQAGSQTAFRLVDLDANLAVARSALSSAVCRIGLVSAMGADTHSRVFYNRVKGELEEALAALCPDALVIARPSLLLGDRVALGQPYRRGERLAQWLGSVLGGLVPAGYRPIPAENVATALLTRVPEARGRLVLSSADMQTPSS